MIRLILHMVSCLKKRTLITLVGLLCLNPGGAVVGQHIEIAIITSDTLTSTQRSLDGIREAVSLAHPGIEFKVFLMDLNNSHNRGIIDSVRIMNPKLILTVGSPATGLAQENFDDLPIVFSGVKYPALSGFVESNARPGKNITGAALDIPVAIQFDYFKRIIPGLKKIGVLYSDNTAGLIPAAMTVASTLGLELVAVKVDDERELPEDLDSLASTMDGIWSVADYNLFSPQSTRYILLKTVRRGIPFMGFSQHVVESGALFALDFDYRAVGIQAGKIANLILAGESPSNIAVTAADVIRFHYNENTARRIKVSIPEDLASEAKGVCR